ncbi:MAG: MarC family protein [Desulfobacteraceae bacterium]
MEYWESAGSFFITALVSLFIIIDPLGNIFPFLALSANFPTPTQRRLAVRACMSAFLILTGFLFLGRAILNYFGITIAAFQITGGFILFRIALEMLEGQSPITRHYTSGSLDARDYRDISLVPLAVPLLSGPGAISTILVLSSRASRSLEIAALFISLACVMLFTYLSFSFATRLAEVLKESGMRLVTRLMGLILAALAVQFILDGLQAAFAFLESQ